MEPERIDRVPILVIGTVTECECADGPHWVLEGWKFGWTEETAPTCAPICPPDTAWDVNGALVIYGWEIHELASLALAPKIAAMMQPSDIINW